MQNETQKSRGRMWAWGTAIVYCLFAAGTIGFVVFASTQKVDLVSEDYYKNEIVYQKQIERMNRTNALKETVTWYISGDGKTVEFKFPNNDITDGTIKFYRPSSSSLDKEFKVTPNADGIQFIPVESLPKGMWKVKVEWSEHNENYYLESNLML
ncbi:MAG: FixH family protein [Bacteroidetes bacterium]|nr:FixH family protein [Bacteroidota bacterium]